jgi:hypothetical protein
MPLYLAGENWRDSNANGFSLPQLVAHLIGSIALSTGTISGSGAALSASINGDTLADSGTQVKVLLLLIPPPLCAL